MRCWLLCILVSVCSIIVGCFVGALSISNSMHHYQFEGEARELKALIEANADFRQLSIHKGTSGHAYVLGSVPSEVARDKLFRGLVEIAGSEWANRCAAAITVSSANTTLDTKKER
jgi:hypothetical protein